MGAATQNEAMLQKNEAVLKKAGLTMAEPKKEILESKITGKTFVIKYGGHAMADRYTYIPAIGLFVMIAWGMTELVSRWVYGRVALSLGAAAVLAGAMAIP